MSLTQEHLYLTERVAANDVELAQFRHDFHGLQLTLEQSHAQHQHICEQARMCFDTLATSHAQVVQERNAAELARQALEQTLDKTCAELETKSATLTSLQHALIKELDVSKKLETELALAQRHGDTWTRFQLISRLLAAHPPENTGLARFRQVLANDLHGLRGI